MMNDFYYDEYDNEDDILQDEEDDRFFSEEVSKEDWISDNQNNLHYIFSFINNFCQTTGFRYFDKCTFPQFCDIAWSMSSGYNLNERYKYT